MVTYMKRITRYFLLLALFSINVETALAQVQNYKELHQVKRKETIFGIARDNGLTIEELIMANPEMNTPGYELKKGDYIKIPYPSNEIRVGVMLPLNDKSTDGKRMLEYYRGVLMACDSLRAIGVSTDIRAWNVTEGSDINKLLADPHVANRDIIIGPYYTKQLKALGDFAMARDIKVFVPFTTYSQEIYNNYNLFQAQQNANQLNEAYVQRFYERLTAMTRPVPRATLPRPCAEGWNRAAYSTALPTCAPAKPCSRRLSP